MKLHSRAVGGHVFCYQPELQRLLIVTPENRARTFDAPDAFRVVALFDGSPADATGAALALMASPRTQSSADTYGHLSWLADKLYDEDPHEQALVYRGVYDRDPLPLHALLDHPVEIKRLCQRDTECDGKHLWVPARAEEAVYVWHVHRASGRVVPPDPIEVRW